jgi:arginase family enzyme
MVLVTTKREDISYTLESSLLDLNATPLPIQPYFSSSRYISRCMLYMSSSSRLVINPYEEFMPIAYTSYSSGSASGSKESGITFLSMHEMNDRMSAASEFSRWIFSKDII